MGLLACYACMHTLIGPSPPPPPPPSHLSFSPVLHQVNSMAQLKEWTGNLTVLFLLVHPEETNEEWQVGVSHEGDTRWICSMMVIAK